jgi:hypothetical protein
MRYSEFRDKIKEYPFFSSNIFKNLTKNPNLLRDQLVDWVKKGYVICLKKGLYTLNENDRKAGVSGFFLANNLYSPSFISLESALSYYGIIPERVYATTSITSKKTQKFENAFGHFIYHHLKKSLFDNFKSEKDEYGNVFNIAIPEKAVMDYFYFRTKGLKKIESDIFELSFRLQNLEILDKNKINNIAVSFNNSRINKITKLFINYLEEHYA